MNDFAVDVGQPIVPTGVAIGQPFVVEAQRMQDRGLEIMHVDGIFGHFKAELVRCTIGESGFDTATRQPHCKGVWVVVSAQRATE